MTSTRLGIIAGGGDLPVRLVESCKAQGRDVFVLALEGQGDPARFGDAPLAVIRLGEAARGFKLLHDHNIKDVVMIGPVRRPTLKELRPDWRTARFFMRIGLKALGDDGLLGAVIKEFESEGFHVLGVDQVVHDLLAPEGVWGRLEPDAQALADIARGFEVATGLGRLDVGQSVVIQQGIVLGVEAIEGTDALIERAGALRRQGSGPVLVKISKPGQDRRADLPTIGCETVENARKNGFSGIAVEMGATLVVGIDEVISAANEANLFVIGKRNEFL